MDKITTIFTVYLWIFTVGFNTVYGQTCNNGDIVNGICYTIVRLSKSYNEAKTYCEDNGGSLASITDKTTQDGIDSLALKNHFPIPELWIGARETINTQSDRVWKWISDDTPILNQGCYKDSSSSRDLPKQISMSSGSFSVEACIANCTSQSYRFAGLQNGDQCFCGNQFGQHGNATGCTVNCPSPLYSPSIPYCGGEFKNTIIDISGSYTRWGYEQPNNHNRYQMCVVLDMDLDTKAADEYCYKRYRYICDMPNKQTCSGDETVTGNGIYYPGSTTGMCYFVSRDAVSNWYVANYNCKQLEGRLAIVNSQEIHSEISYIINDIITADSLITSRKLWIGLRRGGWTWDTGEPFLYTNWKMDEPDSWQANCVMLSRSNSFMWEDRDCATNSFFVCQEGDIPVPATTTTTTPATTITTTTTTGDGQTPSIGQQKDEPVLSTNEIILLVIVLVLFVIAVIVFSIIIYFCCKRKSRRVDAKNSDKRVITGPQSTRSVGSVYSNEFIDINDQTDYYSGAAYSYRY